MEHEDNNTQFGNNYLRGNFDEFSLQHNQQNLVENLQNASGFGGGELVGVVDDIGSVGGGVCIGGKFDEDEHDEEEWKYIQEVQQSEKQQHKQQKMLKVGEEVGDGVGGLDDYNEDEGRDGQMLLPTSEYEEEESVIIKNDGDFSTTSNTTSTTVGEEENSAAAEVEEEEPRELMAMDGDDMAAPLWSRVNDVEKEVAKELAGNEKNSPETVGESSLATGENCENLQQQQHCFGEQHETLSEKTDNYRFSSSPLLFDEEEQKYEADKENADPGVVATATAAVMDPLEDMNYESVKSTEIEPQSLRPSELDLEMHSNLNPDAKEFVPIYSNPTSPISPVKTNDINFPIGVTEERPIESDASPVIDIGVGDKNEIHDDFGSNDCKTENDFDDSLIGDDVVGEPALPASSVSPHPNAVPRHLISTDADDVVAQSPRKGRGLDMDEISLPAVNDFELEANERPHEIEQEDVVVVCNGENDARNEADSTDAASKQMENGENFHREAGDAGMDFADIEQNMEMSSSKEYSDFKHPIDHGPETSVDLDMDMDSQDVMKQSFYIENSAVNTINNYDEEEDLNEKEMKQPIEVLLNTVQPIPTDSEIDDLIDVPSKEMLNVEEKELVSHSPSTEEIQMQFQNEMNFSSNDAFAIPIDMDSIGRMQDSIYMEHTKDQHSSETKIVTTTETSNEIFANMVECESPVATDEHVLLPTQNEPYQADVSNQHETTESIKDDNYEFLSEPTQAEKCVSPAPAELQFTNFLEEKESKELVTPSSPYSTEEKHLMEETKEHLNLNNGMNELEQKMDDLVLEFGSNLQKVDDVAQIATTINQEEIASFVQESEFVQPKLHDELLLEENKIQTSSPSPLLGEEEYKIHANSPSPLLGEKESEVHANSPSPLLREEDQKHLLNQDIIAQFETLNEPNESQIQEEEKSLPVQEESSPVEEIIAAVENASITHAEPFVKDHEANLISEDVSAITHVNESQPTTVEAESLLHSDAKVSVPEDSGALETSKETAAAIVATAATAVTVAAAAAVVASNIEKPIEPVKKTTVGKTSSVTTTAKSKANASVDTKKITEKKAPTASTKTSTTAASTRPRTAPSTTASKTAIGGPSEKKTAATSSAKSVTNTTSARKPLTNNVATFKPAAKAPMTRPTTLSAIKTTSTGATSAKTTLTSKTPTPRPATTTATTRKPLTTSTATAPTQSTAAKPRPMTAGAAPKPSTLNITNKPKVALSPRSTHTSQLRKTVGTVSTGVASTAKSPTKTAATPTTNGSGKLSQTATSSSTNRTKTTTTTSTTTKTFTARPAPKTTSTLTTTTSLNTTSRRATTGSATKPISNPIPRKSSPSKPSAATLGGKVSPTKTNVISKNKTKDVTTPKSVGKAAAGAKEVKGELKGKQLVAAEELVEQPILNGNSHNATGEPVEHTENGGIHDHHTHGENGSIEQGEMALMDATAA